MVLILVGYFAFRSQQKLLFKQELLPIVEKLRKQQLLLQAARSGFGF
jgi:hypothetical protein